VVVTGIALYTLQPTFSHLFICRPGVQAAHHVYQRNRMSDLHPGWAVRDSELTEPLMTYTAGRRQLWVL